MTNKRILAVFRKKDEWLYKALHQLVKTKREMGFKTTTSYELLRLAKNGFSNTMDGRKLDQEILSADTAKTTT